MVTSECESTHCVIHREVFASWKMSPELNVLQEVMKIINDIKVRALNSCLFMQLCEEMDAQHKRLLLQKNNPITVIHSLNRCINSDPIQLLSAMAGQGSKQYLTMAGKKGHSVTASKNFSYWIVL